MSVFRQKVGGDPDHDHKNDVLDYALRYGRRGLSVIRTNGKVPLDAGWPTLQADEATLHTWFGNGAAPNVGIVLGTRSGNIVDVDLDARRAVAVADALLPKTGWLFGRPTHPNSHRIYSVDRVGANLKLADPVLEKTDPGKAMIVELRGDGCQTVFPPSRHAPSGEEIAWADFTEPARVVWDTLVAHVYAVGAAALLARYWPANGSRHDAALALGGALAHTGFPQDDAEQLVRAVAVAAGDPEAEDRVRAAKDSYAALQNGDPVTGWPTLLDVLGAEKTTLVDRVRTWLTTAASVARTQAGLTPPTFDRAPEPICVALRPVPRFDPVMIPVPFRPWLTDIADRGCFPLEYPTAAAMTALSSLVGRQLGIRPKRYDDWTVVPNIWGAIVGPPGFLKSPAVEEPLRPLRRLAAEAGEVYEKDLADYEVRSLVTRAMSKAAKDALEKKARCVKGAQGKEDGGCATDEELRTLAAQALSDGGEKAPTLKRYETNDPSVEKLGELLAENTNGLLLFRDELTGFLRNLDRPGHESDRSFYLEAWNGTGRFVYDRIGRGTINIEAACVALFGTIQPGPLAHYLRAAATVENDGLMPRFQLLFYPDTPEKWENVDRYPDTTVKNIAYEVFKKLADLDPAAFGAEVEEGGIPFLHFAADAQDFFDTWRARLENRLRSGKDGAVMTCHLAKYRSLMPSLALLFHLIDVTGGQAAAGPVTLGSAGAAAAWCDLLEPHARRLYEMAFEGDPEAAERLGERLDRLPRPFTNRDVVKKCWAGLDKPELVERALLLLEGRGWVKEQTLPPGDKGGRPSTVWWASPKLSH